MISSETATILRRVIAPRGASVPHIVAEFLLNLDFPPADHARVAELSLRAQDGTLTDTERRQLEAYLEVDALLSLLRLMARRREGYTLEQHGT